MAAWVLRTEKSEKSLLKNWKRDEVVEPTNSEWAAPSFIVPKIATYRLVVDYRVLNIQLEKRCWPLWGNNEVFDSQEENMYFSNRDLLDSFKWRSLKRVKNKCSFEHLWASRGEDFLWD